MEGMYRSRVASVTVREWIREAPAADAACGRGGASAATAIVKQTTPPIVRYLFRHLFSRFRYKSHPTLKLNFRDRASPCLGSLLDSMRNRASDRHRHWRPTVVTNRALTAGRCYARLHTTSTIRLLPVVLGVDIGPRVCRAAVPEPFLGRLDPGHFAIDKCGN